MINFKFIYYSFGWLY